MRQIILLLLLCTGSFLGFSQEIKPKKINYKKEGYQKARIINEQLDGCGLMIRLEDKAKTILRPQNLKEDFAIEKLKIWIKFSYPKKEVPNICMRGKEIVIEDIRKR